MCIRDRQSTWEEKNKEPHSTHLKMMYNVMFPEEDILNNERYFTSNIFETQSSKTEFKHLKQEIKQKVFLRDCDQSGDHMLDIFKVVGQAQMKDRECSRMLFLTGREMKHSLDYLQKSLEQAHKKNQIFETKLLNSVCKMRKIRKTTTAKKKKKKKKKKKRHRSEKKEKKKKNKKKTRRDKEKRK
eukprot:TRINITY_DN16090_c0_g1_i3.p1 TRINITY_DN16090_c0_g1~~TRINITY_DN16090_c0_g1_i3.p1  ORF type:complete len:194 (-),score=57.60 TRINITY_DN16090_c0_g1_i3:25-579(-)